MAEQRSIKTKIWSDDWYMELPLEAKLLYLFFLTNKATQISGYYELSLKEIEFFTGIKSDKVKKMVKLLEPKVLLHDGWVILKNYSRNQNYANNQKVQSAIDKHMSEIPESIRTLNLNHKSKSKSEAIDSLSIGYKKTVQNIGGEDKDVDKDVKKDEDSVKKKYGEFKNVLLTDTEKEKLKARYGVAPMKTLVEELSLYIPNKAGKPYKDHYATLLTWARKKNLPVQQDYKEPKVIPEVQPDGSVRLIPNPDYHE